MSFRIQLINMGTRAAACKYLRFKWFAQFQRWRLAKISAKKFAEIFKLSSQLCFKDYWTILFDFNDKQFRLSFAAFMTIINDFFTILFHFHQASISQTLSSISLRHYSVSIKFHLKWKYELKLFSQSAVLKDVRNSPLDMIKDPDMDQTRMSSYPNLEYQNLYNAICMLVSSNILH